MAELVTKVQPAELKKPGFAFIRSMPCKITELEHLAKATANGNKRLRLVGLHVFTGKKYEDTLNCSAGARATRALTTHLTCTRRSLSTAGSPPR